jgi:rod shape determining protein RodA
MAAMTGLDTSAPRLSFAQKLWSLNWGLVLLLTVIAGVGFAMLYSAANGDMQPWAARQMVRYAVAVLLMIGVALVDIRFWLRSAYAIFGIAFVLLVAVEVRGAIGMGAQRWIDLGVIQLQPSELMKVALMLALARYFHGLTIEDVGRPLRLVVPALFILLPALLVLKQPDLGTALMLLMCGAAMFFLAGVRLWKFGLVIALAGGALPVIWGHMRDYQRNRIYTFLDPENDPLGSGYHILQS